MERCYRYVPTKDRKIYDNFSLVHWCPVAVESGSVHTQHLISVCNFLFLLDFILLNRPNNVPWWLYTSLVLNVNGSIVTFLMVKVIMKGTWKCWYDNFGISSDWGCHIYGLPSSFPHILSPNFMSSTSPISTTFLRPPPLKSFLNGPLKCYQWLVFF